MHHSKKDKEKIALCAYYKWLEAGSPNGSSGEEFWYAAEQELTTSDVEVSEITDEIALTTD